MGIKLLCLSHQFYRVTDRVYSLSCQMLESHLPLIAVQIHATIGCGIPVSRKGVVRTTGIVASALAGILSKEHTSCIHDLFCKGLVVFGLQDKMLWSIGIT